MYLPRNEQGRHTWRLTLEFVMNWQFPHARQISSSILVKYGSHNIPDKIKPNSLNVFSGICMLKSTIKIAGP